MKHTIRTIAAALLALAVAGCTIPFGESEPRGAAKPVAPQPTGTLMRDGQWAQEGISDDERQADMEDCYDYAIGSIERDRAIDRDSEAAFETAADKRGYSDFKTRMEESGYKRRQARLFGDCMQAKGYYPNRKPLELD